MPLFNGQLKQNQVLTTLYNMIISQEVFANNIDLNDELVSKFMVDGTLYGDTKLFLSTDIGGMTDFPDTTKNLLTKTPPSDIKTQAITVDKFKQATITIDTTKLKQAFMNKGVYSAFVGVVLQWIRDTMKVFNTTYFNAYLGTVKTEATKNVEYVFDGTTASPIMTAITSATETMVEKESALKLLAGQVGARINDILGNLKDVSRDFNDYGYMRAYDLKDFVLVWSKKYYGAMQRAALPLVFHGDKVLNIEMEQYVLNDRYFGRVNDSTGTADAATRVLSYKEVSGSKLYPADNLPASTAFAAGETYEQVNYGDIFTPFPSTAKTKQGNETVAIIVHKRAIPFMKALVIESEFYNPKDLDTNHYLTWGFNTLEYLKEYPIIRIELWADDAG